MDSEYTCEVCRRPASYSITDVKEIEPEEINGQKWMRWTACGLPHFYCTEHVRQSRKIYLPHRTPYEIASFESAEKMIICTAVGMGKITKEQAKQGGYDV